MRDLYGRRLPFIINGLILIALGIYVAGTYYTRFAYDDFCDAIINRQLNLVEAVAWWYNNWTSRWFAAAIDYILKAIGAPLASLYNAALILVWWALTAACLRSMLRRNPQIRLYGTVGASLIVVVTIRCLPGLATTLYWYIGVSTYLTSLVIALLHLLLILRYNSGNRWIVAASFVLPLVNWGASEQIALGHTVGVIIALLAIAVRLLPKSYLPPLLSSLLGAAFGLAVAFAAPGNAIRSGGANHFNAEGLRFALEVAASAPGSPIVVMLNNRLIFLIGLLVVPALIALFVPMDWSQTQRRFARLMITLFFVIICLVEIIETVPTALFLGVAPPEQAWLILMFAFICGITGLGFLLGLAVKPDSQLDRHRAMFGVVGLVICGILIIDLMGHAASTFNKQQVYAQAWDLRDAEIKAQAAEYTPTSEQFVHPFLHPLPQPMQKYWLCGQLMA